MKDALGSHWPEYLMEAAGLGLFMMSAGSFAIVLYHPASPLAQALVQPILRRLLMGCAMGPHCRRPDLLALGQAVGSALQPRRDPDLPPSR